MFTGIVTESGQVKNLKKRGDGLKLEICSKAIAAACRIGDSVSVNGVCLTVAWKAPGILGFDVMAETLKNSNLAFLKDSDMVNLEGSMRSDGTFGGHFVLGHVDCVGTLHEIKKSADNISIEIKIPERFSCLVVDKGSVAVDGVSLTVGEPGKDSFKVYIIPHTLKETTISRMRSGDRVNVEFDIIGKYIFKNSKLKAPRPAHREIRGGQNSKLKTQN